MVGILVHGDNHLIVRGPLADREVALALVRHWSRIQIGATTPPALDRWHIVSREFRENLRCAVVVPGDPEISPAVMRLLEELSERRITIHYSQFELVEQVPRLSSNGMLGNRPCLVAQRLPMVLSGFRTVNARTGSWHSLCSEWDRIAEWTGDNSPTHQQTLLIDAQASAGAFAGLLIVSRLPRRGSRAFHRYITLHPVPRSAEDGSPSPPSNWLPERLVSDG